MGVTLNQVLTLVGRLDDSPGFDTGRERFRRFLLEYITDARIARSLIEQCRHSPGEQHRRALQDLLVLLGRFLGFETAFGTYEPLAGGLKYEGHWRSRGRIHVVLEIGTDPRTDLVNLSRSLEALTATSRLGSEKRALGLCVLTSLYTNPRNLEQGLMSEKSNSEIRLISIDSLLSLTDMMMARRLKHEDVLRLLDSGFALNFVVGLLERFANVDATGDEPRASLSALAIQEEEQAATLKAADAPAVTADSRSHG